MSGSEDMGVSPVVADFAHDGDRLRIQADGVRSSFSASTGVTMPVWQCGIGPYSWRGYTQRSSG